METVGIKFLIVGYMKKRVKRDHLPSFAKKREEKNVPP